MAFQDWDIPNHRKGGRGKMSSDEIALNYLERKYYCLTFNQDVTKDIIAGGYTHLNIKQDDITGEIGLDVNKEKGLLLSRSGKKSLNMKMSSKDWVIRLYKAFNIPIGERRILKITKNLSTIDKCMFFRIINQK